MLGPLPAGDPVVTAFAAGLSESWLESAAEIPVIRSAAGRPRDYLSAGMSRTLRKAANRLAADGRTAVPRFSTDAGQIRGLLPQLEQVYRQRDHAHGRASDLDDAARQQTWRHRVGDLADAGVLELGHAGDRRRARRLHAGDPRRPDVPAARGPVRHRVGALLARPVPRGAGGRAGARRPARVTTFDWMTAVAPESLLGRNDADPMVLVRLG